MPTTRVGPAWIIVAFLGGAGLGVVLLDRVLRLDVVEGGGDFPEDLADEARTAHSGQLNWYVRRLGLRSGLGGEIHRLPGQPPAPKPSR
jgi:hypothetical protein